MTSTVESGRGEARGPAADDAQGALDPTIEGLRALALEEPLRLNVSGQCMEPAIPDRAEILVSPRARYWPGDIVAFRSAMGELRVHRLIGFQWRGGRLLLQTRADASGTLDEPFSSQRVIGRVIAAPAEVRVALHERLASIARFVRLCLGGAFNR